MSPSAARVAVLTSGGDAQAMNAAVRAVVRTVLHAGGEAFGVHEGYDGLAGPEADLRPLGWDDVSRILDRGGTVLGTARSEAFRQREGRRRAAIRLVQNRIDRLVVIGGDGSLTGALRFHDEWPELVADAVEAGELTASQAQQHARLTVLGVPGSIDNDLPGTDVAIGTDSALRQIVDAIDALEATASSHQRTFVVEVMGRNCGYLAAAGAIAGGADYVLVPEAPPEPQWPEQMCELLAAGRSAGRRNSVVVVAEGARDRQGDPITVAAVRALIEDRLGDETRISVPGHVQRGGTPSAGDRITASLLGHAAGRLAATGRRPADAQLLGIRGTEVTIAPLRDALRAAGRIAELSTTGDSAGVRALRGAAFKDLLATSTAMVRALPPARREVTRRIAVLVEGDLAPGMNAAVRALVRLGLPAGVQLLRADGGLLGLTQGRVEPLEWKSVCGWASQAGSQIIAGDAVAVGGAAVVEALQRQAIDGIVILGGWPAFAQAARLEGLGFPVVVLPATIAADVPGSASSVGADSALNWIVTNADRIRHLGTSQVRCVIAETAGRTCGYLPTLTGIAGGAVRVYAPEEDVTADDIRSDARRLADSVGAGQRLGLVVRGEQALGELTTDELCRAFDEGGEGRFTMHQVVPGQTQFGGGPSPADRLLAAQFARCAVVWLTSPMSTGVVVTAIRGGLVEAVPWDEVRGDADLAAGRRTDTWWADLAVISEALSNRPGTSSRLRDEFARSPGGFARSSLVVPAG